MEHTVVDYKSIIINSGIFAFVTLADITPILSAILILSGIIYNGLKIYQWIKEKRDNKRKIK